MRLLKKIITSRFHIENSNKSNFLIKLFKYLANPSLIYKRLVYEFLKSNIELNWEQRAKIIGKNSVISYDFKKKESKLLTKKHLKIIFSVLPQIYNKNLKNNLKAAVGGGGRRTSRQFNKIKILDFGCGYGRLSHDLAKKFNGYVIGVDKSKTLLKLANNSFNVKFIHEKQFIKNKIYKNNYFDLVFLFSVLGGIPNNKIKEVVKILIDSLKFNGLIFFVEQTGSKNLEGIWRTRTREYYYRIFNKVNIKSSNYFTEDGYNFSIFEGIKKPRIFSPGF